MLLEIIIFIILLSAIQAVIRNRIEAIGLDFRYRLFALRDELRAIVISGEASKDSWIFDYLDSSITKTIDLLPRINIWMIISAYLTDRRNPEFLRMKKHLESELKKSENHQLKKIHKEFCSTVGDFLSKRHNIFYYIIIGLSWMLSRIHRSQQLIDIKKFWRKILRQTTESPKISTLAKVCPDPR